MKVVSVVGARPNFVKLAAIEPLLSKSLSHVIIHTGQHYDYELYKAHFKQLKIPEPHYFLGVGSGTHGYQLGEIVKSTEVVLLKERPDLVIVYGDTNSTLAGALAAAKAGFKVAHIEAGLRSFNMNMPEEINRRVVDHISWLLFAPTKSAIENLKRENVLGEAYLVGDVHVDVLNKWINKAERTSDILDKLRLKGEEYVVATIHRVENVENPKRLSDIVRGLKTVRKKLVFPAHPRTLNALRRTGLLRELERRSDILIIKPLGYLDFIKLLKHSWRVITDSGGVQREAYLLGVPCAVLRDRTEWVELVESGWVILVKHKMIELNKVLNLLNPPKRRPPILGDGRAAKRIVKVVIDKLNVL